MITSGGYRGDGRTRNSHRHMSDVIVFWNDPPAPEDLFPIYGENGKKYKNTLGNYHAGCCPNCRCVPSPLIFKDDLKFPVRVYTNGKIVSMNKGEFDSLYNSKTQQMKEEQKREKEKVEQKKENVVSGNSELESKADKLHSKLKEISSKIEAIEKQNTNTSDVNEIERLQKEVQGYIQQLNTIETELKQIEKEVTVDSKFVKDKNPIDFIKQIVADIYFCQEMEEILTNIGTALANYFKYDKIEQKEKDSENKTKINNISYKYLPFKVIEVADEYINKLSDKYPYLVSQIDNYGSFNDELRNIRENYITTLQQGLTKKDIKEKVQENFSMNYPEGGSLFTWNEKNIYIKSREFLNKSLKQWEDERKEKIENDNKYPENCHTLKSALDHEFGHFIYYQLNLNKDIKLQKWIDLYSKYLEQNLSKYSVKNTSNDKYSEIVAEIWSEYCNNPNIWKTENEEKKRITRRIGKYIELLIKKVEVNNPIP